MKLLSGFALVFALACGGQSSNTFVMEPEAPVVGAGEHLRITAQPTVDLGGEMEWEVEEMYGGGLLRSQGPVVTYVAPEAAGTYHLILRAPRLDGRALKQTLTVRVVGSSTLEPDLARVAPGGSVAFTVHMKGLPRRDVRWTVLESGGGEITPDGRYTAPARHGTYHVNAASTVDATVSAQATVMVGN